MIISTLELKNLDFVGVDVEVNKMPNYFLSIRNYFISNLSFADISR